MSSDLQGWAAAASLLDVASRADSEVGTRSGLVEEVRQGWLARARGDGMTFPKGLAEEAGSAGKPRACLIAGTQVGGSVEVLRSEDDRTVASRLARPRNSAAGSGGNTPELHRKETFARRSG